MRTTVLPGGVNWGPSAPFRRQVCHREDLFAGKKPDCRGPGSRPNVSIVNIDMNDATRQIGGTRDVAIIGSIFSTMYIRQLSDSAVLRVLPESAQEIARDGLAQGLQVAAQSPARVAGPLRDTVSDAFMSGLHAGCLTASAVCLAGALFVLAFLPAHPKKADPA